MSHSILWCTLFLIDRVLMWVEKKYKSLHSHSNCPLYSIPFQCILINIEKDPMAYFFYCFISVLLIYCFLMLFDVMPVYWGGRECLLSGGSGQEIFIVTLGMCGLSIWARMEPLFNSQPLLVPRTFTISPFIPRLSDHRIFGKSILSQRRW